MILYHHHHSLISFAPSLWSSSHRLFKAVTFIMCTHIQTPKYLGGFCFEFEYWWWMVGWISGSFLVLFRFSQYTDIILCMMLYKLNILWFLNTLHSTNRIKPVILYLKNPNPKSNPLYIFLVWGSQRLWGTWCCYFGDYSLIIVMKLNRSVFFKATIYCFPVSGDCRLCGVCQPPESSPPQVGQERLWIHPHGCG